MNIKDPWAPEEDASLPPPTTLQGQDDADVGITNWNPVVNAMADAQGVEVGSWDWMLAGIAPWSGSSGEQSSYGWRHTHKLTDSYRRAVLANYGHRRCYYGNAPFRQFGYHAGGRPHGWEPESPGDQADGTTIYLSSRGPITVTGPEAEHLWLTPLFALTDDPNPILVETGMGNRLPSNVVAGFLVNMIAASSAGMVRDVNGDGVKPYPWAYGDRATGRLLHAFLESFRRGLLPNGDIPTVALWIRDVFLAFYESSPGIHSFGGAPEGKFPIGLFNGLHWLVPTCYDAARVLEQIPATKPWAARFDSLVARWTQWTQDMLEVNPEAIRAMKCLVDRSGFEGKQEPVESLAGLIDADSFTFAWDPTAWHFRSLDIMNRVQPSSHLQAARDRCYDENIGRAEKKSWLVNADGEYA